MPLAKINAKLFQLMPKPLLTMDQLKLLKYDNIISKKYKTNFDIKMKQIKNLMMKLINIVLIGLVEDNFQKKNEIKFN